MIYFQKAPGREVSLLTSGTLRTMFHQVLPGDEIAAWAAELGFVERERKLDIGCFVRALVLAGGTPGAGLQADALHAYLDMKVPEICRAAFYQRFDETLEALMARLSAHALAYAATLEVDLPATMGGVSDWHIVDSETVKLRDALVSDLPGCGKYAAIKVHKTLSVGTGCPVRYHFSPAKEHDSPHLDIDESWRGQGFLGDLGYASLARLAACETHGVTYVIRLKENWAPKVDHIARGTVTKTFFKGSDLDALIEADVLVLDEHAIDCDVTLGAARQVKARLVSVPTPKGHCFFLTNLPARLGPWQVADIYRIRWEIELANKLDKTVNRLDETTATKATSVRIMLHASLLASTIAAIAVHLHHLQTRPKPGASRKQAPLHPMAVAKVFDRKADTIADAMDLDDRGDTAAAMLFWDRLALALQRSGEDPNWRRRPSTLDRLRGTKPTPARKKSKPGPKPQRALK
jgi:putative transposase